MTEDLGQPAKVGEKPVPEKLDPLEDFFDEPEDDDEMAVSSN